MIDQPSLHFFHVLHVHGSVVVVVVVVEGCCGDYSNSNKSRIRGNRIYVRGTIEDTTSRWAPSKQHGVFSYLSSARIKVTKVPPLKSVPSPDDTDLS